MLRDIPAEASVELPQGEPPAAAAEDEVSLICSVKANASWKLRPGGISELLGPILLAFEGDTRKHKYADIRLTFNVSVTSRLVYDPRSEATMSMLDRSVPVTRLAYPINAVNGGVNALSFLQVPLHELWGIAPEKRVLIIEGVRVNANQLDYTLKAEHIIASVVISGIPSVPERIPVGMLASKPIFDVQSLKSPADIVRPDRQSLGLRAGPDGHSMSEITHILRVVGPLGGYEAVPSFRTRILARFTLPHEIQVLATIHQLQSSSKTAGARLIQTDVNGAGTALPRQIAAEATLGGKTYTMATLTADTAGLAATWELDDLDGSE